MRRFITRLLEPKEHAVEATFLFLELMNARVTRSTLEIKIKGHPDYPAFLSISDALNDFHVDNLAARFDREQFCDLPVPFMTQITGKKQIDQYTVVKNIGAGKATYFDPESQRWVETSIEDFSQRSSGVVILAEAENQVAEDNYEKKMFQEKRKRASLYMVAFLFPILFIVTIMSAAIGGEATMLIGTVSAILNLTGVFISVLLLWHEVDQSNSLLQEICTSGKKMNCGAILSSKASKIFGISWSTIGFVYFAGNSLMLFFTKLTDPVALLGLTVLNAIALPYVFYSIFYQWKKAKQWCVLCLTVQSLLVIQFISNISNDTYSLGSLKELSNSSLLFFGSYAIPFVTLTLLMPALRKAKRFDSVSLELQRLKHSPEIFNTVLEKQKSVLHDTTGLGITLGNPDGKIKMIKVCNPYCGPCAKAHAPMEELLENNPDLQLQIIFTASNHPSDKRSHPVKLLLAIDETQNKDMTRQALDDWYLPAKRDFEAFQKKYSSFGESSNVTKKVSDMTDWVERTEIRFTPTFFINGYQLPNNYSVNDLKYFLTT